ncbi:hypothetical protein [Paragemmobacter straminiformis]|uniref:DUF91 domain-containing protein n=1 Tax=Paragemmobacter straminiformis TaxID=2045119 RepID=A0A842I4N5_9RHOB|nr:hypothetical protein [Gemmobacter straminiformis]MBC2834531.1 hypothetical protein [Gemmobacter straminiformis]
MLEADAIKVTVPHMTAFLLEGGTSARFERSDLSEGFSESFLQELLFREPDLVPLTQIDPSAVNFIPVCRELTLPKTGGSVFLDVFGITPAGRPVLIECKLWRNPQARREVIAQVLEYAALLRRWSYADLTARLKAKLGWAGENPLFAHVEAHGASLSEAVFTDAVSRNLRSGDFHLLLAGDGIREDATAIAEHIGEKGTRLALVEFQRWRDNSGRQFIVPFIPFKTEVIRQRILTDDRGAALQVVNDDESSVESEAAIAPEQSAVKEANKAFWQSFIDRARFDHPDQSPPRHGGNNWVKILLPPPARWVTAFRMKGRAGLYLVDVPGSGLIERLVEDSASLQEDFGDEPLRLRALHDPNELTIAVDEPDGVTDQLAWLLDASNRLVNVLRPRLSVEEDHRL